MMLMITGTFRASRLSLAHRNNIIIIRQMDCRLRLRAHSSSSRSAEEPQSGVWMWSVENANYSCANGASIILAAVCRCDHTLRYTHNNNNNNTNTNTDSDTDSDISLHPPTDRDTHASIWLTSLLSAVTHTHLQTRACVQTWFSPSHASDHIWTLYHTPTSQAQTHSHATFFKAINK